MSITKKLLSLTKRAGGDLESDPELRKQVLARLLQLGGVGLLGGAAFRTGMGVLRNTNPRYVPPDPPKPVVVDVPYPAPGPLGGMIPTDPKKEKQIKASADVPGLPGLPGLKPGAGLLKRLLPEVAPPKPMGVLTTPKELLSVPKVAPTLTKPIQLPPQIADVNSRFKAIEATAKTPEEAALRKQLVPGVPVKFKGDPQPLFGATGLEYAPRRIPDTTARNALVDHMIEQNRPGAVAYLNAPSLRGVRAMGADVNSPDFDVFNHTAGVPHPVFLRGRIWHESSNYGTPIRARSISPRIVSNYRTYARGTAGALGGVAGASGVGLARKYDVFGRLVRDDDEEELPTKAGFDIENSWFGRHFIPDYTSPLGGPNPGGADDVPLTKALAVPAIGGAGIAGFHVADKILRAADRNKARGELDDAKREYQQAMIQRLMASRLPAKSAADSPTSTDPNIRRIKAALDRAYDAVVSKQAGDPTPTPAAPGQYDPPGQTRKIMMSLLFPGLLAGPAGAAANMGLVGGMASLGGYAGYNYSRDPATMDTVRKKVERRDREDAAGLPAPIIARMVPVPRG